MKFLPNIYIYFCILIQTGPFFYKNQVLNIGSVYYYITTMLLPKSVLFDHFTSTRDMTFLRKYLFHTLPAILFPFNTNFLPGIGLYKPLVLRKDFSNIFGLRDRKIDGAD